MLLKLYAGLLNEADMCKTVKNTGKPDIHTIDPGDLQATFGAKQ